MIDGSEDGQSESLTGSTPAIMSKETRDQKTLFLRRFIVGVTSIFIILFDGTIIYMSTVHKF